MGTVADVRAERLEVVPGAARLRGGGVRMDVEVGRTFTQRPIKAGTVTARPAAPVVR